MQEAILAQGVDLMLYGMGSVFVFLAMLVYATSCMSWFVNRFFPEPVAIPRKVSVPSVVVSTPVDPKVLIIIQDAIHQHRAKNF